MVEGVGFPSAGVARLVRGPLFGGLPAWSLSLSLSLHFRCVQVTGVFCNTAIAARRDARHIESCLKNQGFGPGPIRQHGSQS